MWYILRVLVVILLFLSSTYNCAFVFVFHDFDDNWFIIISCLIFDICMWFNLWFDPSHFSLNIVEKDDEIDELTDVIGDDSNHHVNDDFESLLLLHKSSVPAKTMRSHAINTSFQFGPSFQKSCIVSDAELLFCCLFFIHE